MQKRNFNQARKQREAARKARQQEKLERRRSRTDKPAGDVVTDPATGTAGDSKAVS